MTIKRNRPTVITDAPEHRSIPLGRVQLRADDDKGTVTLTGYASTFEPYEMYGGPKNYGWIEQIAPTAFDKTLRENPDLHLLINHEGMPLARTKSGTLQLSVDKHGLKVESELDLDDPDVQRLRTKMKRGDMDEMSFAFRVRAQAWSATDDFPDDLYAHRTITEVSLHKGDVSVVNFGANPTTHAEVKSVDAAIAVLAECEPADLVEARAAGDSDVLRRAQAALDTLARLRLPGNLRKQPDLTAPAGDDPTPPTPPGPVRMAPDGSRIEAAPAEEPGDATGRSEASGEAPVKVTGMSRTEALRRAGLAPEDGKPMSRADAAAIVAAEQAEIDALRSTEYAQRLPAILEALNS